MEKENVSEIKEDYKEPIKMLMTEEQVGLILDEISKMPDDGLVVEWGSGGTTITFLNALKPNQRFTSIEHDIDYYYTTFKKIFYQRGGFLPIGFKYCLIPSDPFSNTREDYATPREECPVGFGRYICPSEEIFDANIYFVDGYARGACLMTILHKARKKDAVIFLHDYHERTSWYNWAVQFFNVKLITPKGDSREGDSGMVKLTLKERESRK